jgi:hypothetical protein
MPDPSAPQIAELRSRTVALLKASEEDLPYLVFSKGNPQHLSIALLYCTIIQSCSECLVIMAQPTITVPGMLRSIFESFADLRAVIADPKYSDRMVATFYAEKVRHLEYMIEFPTNVYHADVAKNIDPASELVKVKQLLKAIEDSGSRALFGSKPRFVAAHLIEEYQTLYWQLCLDSHNNMGSLQGRHMEPDGNGDFELVLVKQNTAPDLARYYDGIIAVLSDSAVKVHRALNSSRAEKYASLGADLKSFRESLASS